MPCLFKPRTVCCRSLLFLSLILACVSPASASPSVLNVCYEPWEPYVFKDSDGQLRGIAVELFDTALSKLGLTARYEELPFKRCISEVRDGLRDVAMPITGGRENLVDSQTVFAYWTLAAIVPKSSPLESPVTLDALNELSVIIIDGYEYPKKITSWAEDHPRLVEVTYSADGAGMVPYRMLEFGRADVFIEDNYWSANLIEANGLDLKVLDPALDSIISVAGYRRELAGLRDRIDLAVRGLGQTFRDDLFISYTGFPEAFFSGRSRAAAAVD